MFQEVETVQDRNGSSYFLRSLTKADAEDFLALMKRAYGQSPYLLREEEEASTNLVGCEEFLSSHERDPRSILLGIWKDDQLLAQGELSPVGHGRKVAHRGTIALVVDQTYARRGLGRLLMEELLTVAKECKFEQIELSAFEDNQAALSLYQTFGFQILGKTPNAYHQKDGSKHADLLLFKPI